MEFRILNYNPREMSKLGGKACFNRKQFDSSSNLKINTIFPIRILLDLKVVTYFWKYQNTLLPAFKSSNKIATALIKMQSRTKVISCGCQAKIVSS